MDHPHRTAGRPGRRMSFALLRPTTVAGSLLGLFLVLVGAGCGSLSEPNSASFASVTIENRTPAEIASATVRVFQADGYEGDADATEPMVFEKEASRATTISRAGLVAAHEGERTIYRVRVEIVPVDERVHRLECQAYVVTGSGLLEDEVRVTHLRRGPYRSLLSKVKAELK